MSIFWPFISKKEARRRDKEETLRVLIASSQLALLEAATTTADAAQHVTSKLRQHLEDSVRQFESTAHLISDALIICDIDGSVRAFNPAAEIIFATTTNDIDKKSVTRLFRLNGDIPNASVLWSSIEKNLDGSLDSPLQGYRCNDESFPIDATLSRLDKQDGTSLILLLIRDLTDSLESQKITEATQQRFQSLFDMSFDGILIIQDSKIVAANKAASNMFGMEPDILLNTPSNLLLKGTNIHNIPLESDSFKQDGTKLQLLFSSTGIKWNGSSAHLVTIKDVSELRQLQSALQAQKDNNVMVCVLDENLKIKFSNYYFNDYYKCSNVIGKDIRDFLPSSDKDTIEVKLMRLTPNNHTARSQIQHINENGVTRLLDWVDHAIFDSNGKVIEYQRTGRDITSVLDSLRTTKINEII